MAPADVAQGAMDAAPVDATPDEAGVDQGAGEDGAAGDAGQVACKNTPDDCGPPANCTSCANSSLGHQCVKMACGCLSAADCDPGRACVNGACAVMGCDDAHPCMGGCCDRGACTDGNQHGKCGGDGKACIACAGGTPTCVAGACKAKCVAGKPGDPGVCGMGFCCGGADDECQPIAANACGAAGASCTDCAKSASGPKCISGSCGCAAPADCSKGQACKGGKCGLACDGNAPCNGGCCAMGQCADGTSPTACALGGALCGSCAGDLAGRACIPSPMNASCGCKSQADCPTGMACDPKTSKCAKECDANRPCNGGCCSAAQNGQCVAGTGNGACGANGGVCADCAKVVQGGKLCFPTAGGGFCGCNTLGDCVGGAIACDGQTHACDFSCNVNQPCKTGCCSAGKCASGQSASACGRTGMCVDCGMSLLGRACLVTQSCGCDRAEDCPAGQACDLGTHTCTTKCNANQPCNGGCCVNSACVAGKDGKACGSTGGACIDCSNSQLGHACVGGSVCGCAVTADCPIAQACDPQKKLCVDTCIANQPCNGGCCLNGKCTAGISNSACGAIGKDCAPCSGTKPTCENGVCTAKCGGVGDGICDQGTCCSNGACVPGTTGAACGYSGTCVSCKGSSLGQKCIALMNAKDWTCGCDSQTDCLASNPKGGIPGQTCDMSFHTCTSLCGAMGVTICNGGCCSGPNGQCRPGNRDSACGVTGSFCASCSDGCQPGPRCDEDKGTCGCFRAFSVQGDVTCNGVFACFGNTNKFGCSLGTNRCCVPGVYNFKDLGNPGNCCTGQSVGGLCTCNLAGESAGTPSNPWFCCSLALDMMGNCACLKNGSRANFGGGVEKRACCSLKTTGDNCVAAGKGEACQTSDGCAAPLTCQAGKCA